MIFTWFSTGRGQTATDRPFRGQVKEYVVPAAPGVLGAFLGVLAGHSEGHGQAVVQLPKFAFGQRIDLVAKAAFVDGSDLLTLDAGQGVSGKVNVELHRVQAAGGVGGHVGDDHRRGTGVPGVVLDDYDRARLPFLTSDSVGASQAKEDVAAFYSVRVFFPLSVLSSGRVRDMGRVRFRSTFRNKPDRFPGPFADTDRGPSSSPGGRIRNRSSRSVTAFDYVKTDGLAAEDQGFVVVLEVDVDGVPFDRPAAILNDTFAQAVYVKDHSRWID